ncbi:TPA: helix-turn-helix domain-containing protein [Vibrio alginolyticus]|nr:helix-turn-helix domain-containing protein [Vibrio alginolyticus]
MGNFLTISEAIEKYQVTRKTLYNWRSNGKLEFDNNSSKVLISEDSLKSLASLRKIDRDGVVTQDLHSKLDSLTEKVTQLEQVITHLLDKVKKGNEKVDRLESLLTHQKTANKLERAGIDQSYHQSRAKKVIEKGRSAYQSLTKELDREPQKTEVSERAEIARGSVNKYWEEITS